MRCTLVAVLMLAACACSDTGDSGATPDTPSYEKHWQNAVAIYEVARTRVNGRLGTPAEFPGISRDSMTFERDDDGEWTFSQPPVIIFVDSSWAIATVLGEYRTDDREGEFTVRLNHKPGTSEPLWEAQSLRPDFSDVDLTE